MMAKNYILYFIINFMICHVPPFSCLLRLFNRFITNQVPLSIYLHRSPHHSPVLHQMKISKIEEERNSINLGLVDHNNSLKVKSLSILFLLPPPALLALRELVASLCQTHSKSEGASYSETYTECVRERRRVHSQNLA
jgi:hypothetical protein